MRANIKPVLICVLTAGLCAILIAMLDTFTGVPFNYAVPIALIISLIPYVFLLRAHHGESAGLRPVAIAESDDQPGERRFEAHESGRRHARAWDDPATIHSFVFTPASQQVRLGRSAEDA
jgi:hypothetical protein